MTERTLRRILLGLVLLGVAYGGAVLFRSGLGTWFPGDGDAASRLSGVLGSLEPAEVEEVEIRRPGEEPLVLARRGDGGWTVNGFRADSGRVARFWDALTGTDPGGVVARNPENHPRLGVDVGSATELHIRAADGTEHRLLLGGGGSTQPDVPVRLADENEVHLLGSGLAVAAGQSETTWRDHTIVAVDTSRIRAVENTVGDDGYVLRRSEDGAWTLDGEPVPAIRARNMVGGLRRVLAADFLGSAEERFGDAGEEDVQGPARSMVVLDAGGDTLADLDVRGSPDEGFRVRVPGDSVVYEIAPFDVLRLFPSRETLTAPEDGAP